MGIAVRFCVSGGSKHGMGHLYRCTKLADLITRNTVSLSQIEFTGNLDTSALKWFESGKFGPCWSGSIPGNPAALCVIDRMFDVVDMEKYDVDLIHKIAHHTHDRILICSSQFLPAQLPIDMAIGYLLQPDKNATYQIHTGLEFAPVEESVLDYRGQRRYIDEKINHCLIAFGNWGDAKAPLNCLSGLCDVGFKGKVSMIVPPAHRSFIDQFKVAGDGLDLEFQAGVKDIYQALAATDLLLGSYGLLTYEAMTIGLPCVIVPVKRFMAEYGRSLTELGVAKLASNSIDGSINDIVSIIQSMECVTTRKGIRDQCDAIFDGKGLGRVAEIIGSRLNT
ncbi:hypothetical protein N8628_04200 [Verrucomicrobia bacterium]|nr:hypothetical protein [Verrucomicrobiota bacterium]